MSTERRHRRAALRLLVAAAVVGGVVLPQATGAQEPNPEKTKRELDDVRAQRGEVDLQIDALTAKSADLEDAIGALETNVATQQAELDEAERALQEAEDDLATAEENVARAQARIDALDRQTDQLVVEAFVNPESESALEGFKAHTLSDLMVRRALVDIQADADADTLDQLALAHQDLEAEKAAKQVAAADAEQKRGEAQSALEDVTNALAQQKIFAADVEERLNASLAEAESLKSIDAELAQKLEAEQAEVARRLREAREAAERKAAAEAAAAAQARADAAAAAQAQQAAADRSSSSAGGGSTSSASSTGSGSSNGSGGAAPASAVLPAPGGLATVTCPYGGSITVAGSIAGNVQALLNAAAAQGVSLCGSGYRSPDRQVQLRMQHCGTSYYAIYQMSPSQCSPPTARPGSSLHEQGLAIDFTCNGGGAIRYGNSCWNFLAANANSYGLYNLPSEPWHWSTTGH